MYNILERTEKKYIIVTALFITSKKKLRSEKYFQKIRNQIRFQQRKREIEKRNKLSLNNLLGKQKRQKGKQKL